MENEVDGRRFTLALYWTGVSVRPLHRNCVLMDGYLSRAAILPWHVGVTMEGQVMGASVVTNGSAPKPRAAGGRWTVQQRREIRKASMVDGTVIGEVASRYGVRAALIVSWRRRIERQPARGSRAKSTPKFAAVGIDRVSTNGVIEINLANRCICVRGIVDAATLREMLAATGSVARHG